MAEASDRERAMPSPGPSQDLNDEMPVDSNKPTGTQAKTITPEPRLDQLVNATQNTPSTPGLLAPFDWDEFESRYEKALTEADYQEQATLKEFDRLVRYFNVWASASSAHDNERAVKRLQTRQRYVALSEESVSQRQKHYDEVLRAFQSALALLSSK
jgi:uncharacterized protein YeaO (DUF488 family)